MIIIQFFGGLGNQMFQYAFGRFLSIKYNKPLYFDKRIYEENRSNRMFDIDIFTLGSAIIDDPEVLNLNSVELYELCEHSFSFDNEALNVLDDGNSANILLLISGYWQSYKYFQSIETIIRNDFRFNREITGKWKLMMDRIQAVNAVMINVRRGDYLEPGKMTIHGVVSREYIESGMAICRQNTYKPFFFVFSDGMGWCRANIPLAPDVIFVDETYYDDKYEFYLQLMSGCKHFIISNSTFSWWAAWLSQHKDKIVIYPEKWFTASEPDTKDLIPEGWIKL